MRTRKKIGDDDMPAELDFDRLGPPVVAKHYEKAMAKAPVVRLAPDVAVAFPSEQSVNAALRGLLRQRSQPISKSGKRRKRAAR
jgi:hypothetical protein